MHTKENILKGITRKHVIKLAESHFQIIERKVTLNELWNADEIFVTGTTKKIIPVKNIDGKSFGEPGNITKILMTQFDKMVGSI